MQCLFYGCRGQLFLLSCKKGTNGILLCEHSMNEIMKFSPDMLDATGHQMLIEYA